MSLEFLTYNHKRIYNYLQISQENLFYFYFAKIREEPESDSFSVIINSY